MCVCVCEYVCECVCECVSVCVCVCECVCVHTCIHNRLVLQGKAGSLHEGRHKAKLDAMFTNKGLLELLPQLNETAHINLVEGGQHGVSVLSVLQSLCNPLPHSVHLNLTGEREREREREREIGQACAL